MATPTELQRLLADEFQRNGWTYDLSTARILVVALERSGTADARALSRAVPQEFFVRNATTRRAVAAAIERAVGGQSVERPLAPTTTLVINDHRYSLSLGPRARLESSSINIGGSQVVVSQDVDRNDVLKAVEVLVRAGLSGEWNAAAAAELAIIVDGRKDISVDDVRELTSEVISQEQPVGQRVTTFLSEVATNAIGGALGAGISAGLGGFL